MKRISLLSFLLLCIFSLHAQVIKFSKVYPIWNEQAFNNFQQTSDGGYILCTDSPPEQDTAVAQKGYGYLIKMSPQGQTQWIKKYPKTNYFMKSYDGNSVFQTSDGGYIIGTDQYTNSNPSLYQGTTAIYLIKTDVSGNMLWSKTYAGVGNSSCFCIKQTADLGYIVCGNTTDTIQNIQYTYLLKTDNSGVAQWGKTYVETVSGQGGTGMSVNQTSDGGYVIAGYSNSGGFIMKTDNAGTIQWNHNMGQPGSDLIYCVKQTSDAGFIATGTGILNSGAGLTLLKLDSGGTIQWKNIYTQSTSSADEGYTVEEVPGGYAVLGVTNYANPILFKTDVSGNILWSTEYYYGMAFQPSGLNKTTDGGYAFTCIYNTGFVAGVEVIKTDSLGIASCGDTTFLLTDTIYSPQVDPPFTMGSTFPWTTVNTVFMNVTLNDSLLCPASKDVGIADFTNENSISIFPNPTSGNFSLQINSAIESSAEIKIYNSLGEMVMEKKEKNISGNFKEDFSLGEMSDGIYFVSVQLGNEIVLTKKMVKGN
jgi:hypothetical protein